MNKMFWALLSIIILTGSAFAVSTDLQVPGYLNVTGVSTFENKITSSGPMTLESGANGRIVLTPNGTGYVSLNGNTTIEGANTLRGAANTVLVAGNSVIVGPNSTTQYMMQFGVSAAATVTFPVAFAATPVVTITPNAATVTANFYISAVSTTAFTVTSGGTTFHWIAIGQK